MSQTPASANQEIVTQPFDHGQPPLLKPEGVSLFQVLSICFVILIIGTMVAVLHVEVSIKPWVKALQLTSDIKPLIADEFDGEDLSDIDEDDDFVELQ